jgi:hypothetical protein
MAAQPTTGNRRQVSKLWRCRETFSDDSKPQFSPLPVKSTQEIKMAVEPAGLKIPAESNLAECCRMHILLALLESKRVGLKTR